MENASVLRFAQDDNLAGIKRGHASPKIVPFSFARENSKILGVRAGEATSMNRPLLIEASARSYFRSSSTGV
jgi:hypothetical protein